ncbi:MAG: hypothetical protein U1E27_14685 [Kiritimatiellia bacterium]|nr:hypothetical protein [Kiritimatiellia bacterium]
MSTKVSPSAPPSGKHRTVGSLFGEVAFWQGLGFFALICLIWAKEAMDFPSLFYGVPESPPDWLGASLLTAGVLVIGFVVVANTYLQQSRVLKGFISVCSYCRKVHVEETSWEQMETFISENTLAEFTHGVCPSCYKTLMADLEKEADSPTLP